ncbi:MAG: hypothetical protein HYS21_00735 [Deltaproteobacteria bacterium]|nr:hypothetical protein [Deltaproteobacteria bacterium]
MIKKLLICFCVLFAIEGVAFAGQGPLVFMSSDKEGLKKGDSFDCRNKIFIHADFSGLKNKAHAASVVWINPQGRKQDDADYKFSGKAHHVWFLLELHPALGGKLFKSIDPSIGMEEFIGAWSANFYLDNRLVESRLFYVAC